MVTAAQIRELERQTESDFILDDVPKMTLLKGLVLAEPKPVPAEPFALGSLRDGRLRVVEPFEVVPMLEGGTYVVEAPELNEFGFGDNLSEALSDLQPAIAELYFTLETDREQLGPDLSSVWAELSQKVRKADAICCS